MKKRKQDLIDDPWDVEVAYFIGKKGIDPNKARTFVIIRWMYHGDLRPLAAAIWKGHPLDQDVLNWLAKLIDDGRLTVKTPRHGRPKPPDKFGRDILAALFYENRTTNNSENAFREIADAFGTSHQSIRHAVTRWRKMNAANAK